jgi:hypothetical protein
MLLVCMPSCLPAALPENFLQSELDAARKSHKEALEAASAAEKKALLLEVRQQDDVAPQLCCGR